MEIIFITVKASVYLNLLSPEKLQFKVTRGAEKFQPNSRVFCVAKLYRDYIK